MKAISVVILSKDGEIRIDLYTPLVFFFSIGYHGRRTCVCFI